MKQKNRRKYKDSIRWILVIQAIFFLLTILFPDNIFSTVLVVVIGLVAFVFAVISLVIKEE
ncbi:MAG TPA: hypothetical protein PK685_02440 [archaeon]|nr:hypothetical protein [archaeon]